MYVIVESGNKQYKIKRGDVIEVEKLSKKPSGTIKLDKVLLFDDGKNVRIGNPYLKDVSVNCDVLNNIRGGKVISFRYRRRKSSKKKIGHRQYLTRLKVTEIKTT